jgi:hypothetical protein
MHRGIALGAVVVVAAISVGFTGVAAAGSAPYVDAGLDQEVYVGDRVYLDGGGTWDDDGDITSKEWQIETPDGNTIEPDCPDCWFTHFQANQTGQYDVTLTVRDSEGNENSDTLYVTTQDLEPEMREPASETDASGGGGGCWVAPTGGSGDNSLDLEVCNVHGNAVDFEWTDGGEGESIQAVVFENEGLVLEYSDRVFNPDGTVSIPMDVFLGEVEQIWNNYQKSDHASGANEIGGGQRNGDTGATGGGSTVGGCVAPCGAPMP